MTGGLGDIAVTTQGGRANAHGPSEPNNTAFLATGGAASVVGVPVQGRRTGGETATGQESLAALLPAEGEDGARFSTWLRLWGLHVEVMVAFVAGAVAAFLTDPQPLVALGALGAWMLGAYHRGRAVTTPLTRQLRTVFQSALLPLAGVAVGVGFFSVAPEVVPRVSAALAAAVATSVACRGVRWRLQAPVRIVVVGDRAAVATATARWARSSDVRVVGGLLVEPDLAAEAVPQEILGVRTARGLDSAETLVRHWRADLIVVTPGPGLSAEAFRRLTWSLEQTRVAIGVSGVLESVAPHRITPGGIQRSAILDVRPPRPSRFVRGLKAAIDRVGGALLLLLFAPLLVAMAVAVRLDSAGPAFFTQTRIGQAGRPFRVYKMRTMVPDADAIKARLSDANEFDSVLFKMKRDPRVTRVGHFLRRSSLDELPQLFNVVRGEMSLVGPRPFLPDEIARMDEDTLRRHVVKPGITGLWQVSGRSDLAWDESAALDTYYADNWSLLGDLTISARTVSAVATSKGAY
jgi:exopolysaccharide biosynthesis polyprenyl glycosylphosphotransferase